MRRAFATGSISLCLGRTFIEENHVCASHAVALARHYSAAPTQPHKEASALYVTSALGRKSPSPVLLGLMERFQRHHPSVGFFMPVGTDFMPGSNPPIPKHAALLMAHCALQDPPATMVGVSEADAEALIASGREDEFVDRVWTAYGRHRSGKDLVLIEGAAVEGVGAPVEFHGRLAAELGAPVLLTVDFRRDETVTVDEAVARAVIAGHEVKSAGADLLGIIINKMPADASEAMKTEIKEQLQSKGMHCFGMVPWDPIIGAVRVNELSAALNARQLAGDGLDSTVSGIVIAGQSAGCLLDELDRAAHVLCADSMSGQRPVVMASADRADVALTLAAAHASGAGPVIAALILCNASHMRLPSTAHRILRRFPYNDLFPVLATDLDLFEATKQVSLVNPGILPDSVGKAQHATDLFMHHVDVDALEARLLLPRSPHLTPKHFLHSIHERCRSQPQHIVLPEGTDRRVLSAAAEVVRKKLAKVTLLGAVDAVYAAARKWGIDLGGCEILDHRQSPRIEAYADALAAARASKGLTRDQALDQLDDANVFATMMVRQKDAAGMVSGATCTTAATIRPALQVLRPAGGGIVSSIFFMLLPDKVLVYGDCAVNVDPTAEELAHIAVTSADTAAAFGLEPRVALLSYSTLGSGAGPAVDKVALATELARSHRPDLADLILGPVQYDAAVDPEVAKQKVKDGPGAQVAGRATVLIFPDLNSGNNTYKAVQRSTSALAIGPLLQGLAKPVNDLSRGCTVDDIVNTVACTAVQAVAAKNIE